jgi:predicted RNase H-like HicB family nuclease
MKYRVVLVKSEEDLAVGWSALLDCWSQGRTLDEAKVNIRDAFHL